VHFQSNFEVGLFQDVTDQDTNNIGQYRLGLQIDSLDRNVHVQPRKLDTKTKNYQRNKEEH